MAELSIEVVRALEEMALKFTTVENLETVTTFLRHCMAVLANALLALH